MQEIFFANSVDLSPLVFSSERSNMVRDYPANEVFGNNTRMDAKKLQKNKKRIRPYYTQY